MKRNMVRVGLGISICFVLSAGIVFARGGDDSVEQTVTTSPASAVGTGNGGGSVVVQQNTGGNVQRKFIENDSSTSPNMSFLNKDNLKEFGGEQNKEIEAFRKKKMEEFKLKSRSVREQRKTCMDRIKQITKERQQRRLELQKSCKPTLSASEPANADDAKSQAMEARQLMISCKQKIVEFEKETKKQILNLRIQCFHSERNVLRLSTTTPWNR